MFQGQQNSNQPLNNFNDFPSMQPNSSGNAGGDNVFAGFATGSQDFNAGANEFVPTGVVAGKEEFPDLDEGFGSGTGKKKKQ